MVRSKSIQIRLTYPQYERIKTDVENGGFGSISTYLRFLALHRDKAIARKIIEIHDAVVRKKECRQEKHENELLRSSS